MDCDAGQMSAISLTMILGVSRYKQSGRLALLKDRNNFTNENNMVKYIITAGRRQNSWLFT